MTAAESIESQKNIVDIIWLQSQHTQRMLLKLEGMRLEKLTQASRASANPSCQDLQLRLLLREASVIEEIITLIKGQ